MNREAIFKLFEAQGHHIYQVGGSVRDRLLKLEVHDLDFCTDARPDEIYDLLKHVGNPYRIGEKFGTIGVASAETNVEVTTFRSDSYTNGSRKPEVVFGDSLGEDLSRRDFTINAIAMDKGGLIIDPFNGRGDLDKRLIRTVDDPEQRFSEDPLRLLRAVRLAGTLGFAIEGDTSQAIRRKARSLLNISQERIQEELCKIICSPAASIGMDRLKRFGLLAFIAPELMMLADESDQGVHHYEELWHHTIRVMTGVEGLELRLAALFHDIGKMATRSETESGVHFYGHAEVSAIIAKSVMRRMHFPNNITDGVVLLVENHMKVNDYSAEWSDAAVRRLYARLGVRFYDALDLARSDARAHTEGDANRFNDLTLRVNVVGGTEDMGSPLSGFELMSYYNRNAGPWIKDMKNLLREAVIEGHIPPGDKDAARNLIAAWEEVARSE